MIDDREPIGPCACTVVTACKGTIGDCASSIEPCHLHKLWLTINLDERSRLINHENLFEKLRSMTTPYQYCSDGAGLILATILTILPAKDRVA